MIKSQTVCRITNGAAIAAALLAIWHSLIAPLLLFLGVLYLGRTITLLAFGRKLDRPGIALATGFLSLLVGVYFLPLWIAERENQTPEGHLLLAEKFSRRGQLLGNKTKALAHYRLAAEGGNLEAQVRLGQALFFGHYGPANRTESLKWLKIAAANGDSRAQRLLGYSETP